MKELLDMRRVTPDLMEALNVSMTTRMEADKTDPARELPEDIKALFDVLKASKATREMFHRLGHTVENAVRIDCGVLGSMAVAMVFIFGFSLAQAMLESAELTKMVDGPLANYQN